MDLWIRSQDRKELIPQPTLYAIYSESEKYAYIGNSITGHIGKYKTLERALEVLDEIQDFIEYQGNSYLKTNEMGIPDEIKNYGKVYEMPIE